MDKGDDGHASEGAQNLTDLLEKGILLEQQGQLDDALREYDKAVQLAPDFAKAHFFRGNILLAKGDAVAAKAAYEAALVNKPDSAPAHYNLGNAYLRMGSHEEAVAAYKPVSYTHLDVYKRQALNNMKDGKQLDRVQRPRRRQRACSSQRDVSFRRQHCSGPVSYTHLCPEEQDSAKRVRRRSGCCRVGQQKPKAPGSLMARAGRAGTQGSLQGHW